VEEIAKKDSIQLIQADKLNNKTESPNRGNWGIIDGGAEGDRTHDLLTASHQAQSPLFILIH
jgi:hypothetical protein